MPETEKFSTYVRLSMHAALLTIAILSFRQVLASPGEFQDSLVLLVVLINGGLTALTIERTSAFSTTPRPLGKLYPGAIAVNLLCWTISICLLVTQRAPHLTEIIGGLSVFLLLSFAFVLSIHIKHAYLLVVALSVITAFVVEHPELDHPVYIVAFALVLVLLNKVTVWSVGIVKALYRTRELQSQLKIQEERLRFAQELHDSLGQRLAAMSLKTQLAISLHRKDADRTDDELRDIEKLVRLMRMDLHQVVTGYRTLHPNSELEDASSLLRKANIAVTVTGHPQDIPKSCQQTAAWFIREATTNVMKHSNASNVYVTFSEHAVSITNDGVARNFGPLGGIQALQERAKQIGGTISLIHQNNQCTATLSWKGTNR
ncbi:histidine kinase [Corynebacterium propinquum]|uniref:sensor histidine kinase n=1 Tax=Corynebacterium propinquum TaxID=43769 RepID=UPI0021C4B9B0|nr:histidine kinase [Corynebacterium propinquum]WKS33518.1 histidine kinase [Corynebacterium propinquum]WKS40032.1 histidine kinase [Corynebacterium propinquum]